MTSEYLSDENTKRHRERVIRRVAGEVVPDEDGLPTWPPDSDYWLLPEYVRQEILALILEEGVDAP